MNARSFLVLVFAFLFAVSGCVHQMRELYALVPPGALTSTGGGLAFLKPPLNDEQLLEFRQRVELYLIPGETCSHDCGILIELRYMSSSQPEEVHDFLAQIVGYSIAYSHGQPVWVRLVLDDSPRGVPINAWMMIGRVQVGR